MANDKAAIWSGFWRRVFAWIIDSIVLGAVCYAIGWLAMDYVSAWGTNGRVVGLTLGILYFGVTASGLGGGRSVGMRICGLKVARMNGRPLGLLAALLRAVVLVAPWMLNGWYFQTKDTMLATVIGVAAITAVFGVTLAQIYLLLFNLPTRRMVHDLISGSIVVRDDVESFEAPKRPAHVVVAALLILAAPGLAVAGPSILSAWMPKATAATSAAQKVVDAVNALPEVAETDATDNTTTYFATGRPNNTVRTLVVTARVRKWPADVNRELARIGAATVKSYTFAPDQHLTVKIVQGFDLGFASYNNFQSNQFSTSCTDPDVNCLDK